jgi:hypothetical protein
MPARASRSALLPLTCRTWRQNSIILRRFGFDWSSKNGRVFYSGCASTGNSTHTFFGAPRSGGNCCVTLAYGRFQPFRDSYMVPAMQRPLPIAARRGNLVHVPCTNYATVMVSSPVLPDIARLFTTIPSSLRHQYCVMENGWACGCHNQTS